MASGNTSQANQVTKPKKFWRHPFVWTVIIFLWMSIIIPVVGSIFSNAFVLPDAWKQAMTRFSGWLFANPPLLIACFFILILCTVIAFLLTRERADQETAPPIPAPVHVQITLPDPAPSVPLIPPVPTDVREKYLRIMLQKTLSLNLEGIPTPYRLPNVLLEEVFIPLEFLPRRLDSDYEITKEEGQYYLELEQKGTVPEDLERVFIDREHRLLERLKDEQRITISDLWQHLDRKHATAVIQGQPGMGKSTLLARLTLHFAKLGITEPDALMSQPLETSGSVPIPILLILKDYATEYEKNYKAAQSLSVLDYLLQTTKNIPLPDLFAFLKDALTDGRCLVLFDGLDEISNLTIRRLIRDEIERFITDYSAIPSGATFNRFLITSRVAGYEVVVFQHYWHITVAALKEEQIKNFLPRWCRASLPTPEIVGSDKHKALLQEADLTAQRVMSAITTSSGARKLANNPLLLTLLVVLQQNRVELPRQRYKLYSAITTMMLENRNADKFLPAIEEKQAIERLGPLAYDMQVKNNDFASKRTVHNSLCKIIADEGSGATPIEIDKEAETFLHRIRERSGLFVIRTGDYYGFFHRTFQEYFVARYILNQVKRNSATWITTFVEHARRTDDLWREPFLLAIAYQSGEDETIAQEIITALLDRPQQDTSEQQVHDILLAAESLLEAKPLGRTLETHIAEHLLLNYEHAQHMFEYHNKLEYHNTLEYYSSGEHIKRIVKYSDACRNIEDTFSALMLNISQEAFRPALLDVFYKNICATQQISLQQATLTLLVMIAQTLREGPNLIFTKLIPPLLSLAGLPAVSKNNPEGKRYDPDPEVACAYNLDIADLALTALSFMDKRGPAGILLLETQHYFKREHSAQLRQLAYFSLQSETLITPAVVPLADENYQQYATAIEQWLDLKKSYDVAMITEDDIDTCVLIHEELLACTEEVAYPTTIHIQCMLQASENDPTNWCSIWQNYLLTQLNSGSYVKYRESTLLWAILFSSEQEQKKLATVIINSITNDSNPIQRYGLHLISSLITDERNIWGFGAINSLRDLRKSRDLREIKYLSYLKEQTIAQYLISFSDMGDLRGLKALIGMDGAIFSLGELGNFNDIGKLPSFLFTKLIAIKSITLLFSPNTPFDGGKCLDLLTILIGRLFCILESNEMGKDIEQETLQIAQTALSFLVSTNTQEIIEAARGILCSLPARTANEITFVLHQAESAMDQDVKAAYIRALRYAEPHDKAAWDALMKGKSSHVQSIQEAVEVVLKNREQTKYPTY